MKFTPWLALAAAPWFLAACAPKQQVKPAPTPTPETSETRASAPETSPSEHYHYHVRTGDSLWAIAARSRVFGDPFAWPLLYRENRDQIQDPDLIYPRQDLDYMRQATPESLAAARKIAAATPPYHRKELPLR